MRKGDKKPGPPGSTFATEQREMLLQVATPAQREAVAFLESKGFEFLVHFGYANAISRMNEYRMYEGIGQLDWFYENMGMEPPRKKKARSGDRRKGKEKRKAEEPEGPVRVFR